MVLLMLRQRLLYTFAAYPPPPHHQQTKTDNNLFIVLQTLVTWGWFSRYNVFSCIYTKYHTNGSAKQDTVIVVVLQCCPRIKN